MTDRLHRRRPSSRGPHGSLWAAVRRLARGNDADFAAWDDEHDDDHLARRRPILVTTYGATWRGLRPYVGDAPMDALTDSEWGRAIREAAEARRAARKPWGSNRMQPSWETQ